MKLTAVLVLILVTAAKAGPAPQSDVTDDRQQRVFLTGYPNPLTDLLGFNTPTVTVSKTPSVPKIIYVQKAPTAGRACQTPHAADGCPAGYVCSAGWQCVPLKQPGESCTAGYQCLGGTCRQYHCVRDSCPTAGQQSGCPDGQTCVATDAGRVCRPTDDSCSPPLQWANCPSGQFCGKNGHCQPKLPVNANCRTAIQCQHGICRHYRCKNDACPTIDSSLDCQPTQYCTSSPEGNVCKAKRANGKLCTSDNQCQSHRCENTKCVQHQCPTRYSAAHCPPQQYCMPGPQGNVCREKLNKGADCSAAIMCKSGQCIRGHCFENECPVPMASDGCSLNQICMSTKNGNTCMMKLPNNAQCTGNIQCLSNFCSGHVCRPQPPVTQPTTPPSSSTTSSPPTSQSTTPTTPTTPTTTTTATPLKPNNAACAAPAECQSGRCVGDICVAPKKDNGGSCSAANLAGNSECRSNNCQTDAASATGFSCALGSLGAGSACSDDLQCAQAQCRDGTC